MGVEYTREQQQVIKLRNRNILVSAAAGSGKTAVLVERIITMLTKDASPIDVDQLLVVTFTEAAAAEMKERIRNAIEKALEENPENLHLQRQATLIHHAQVTTIHSFCLSVIRDYFHTIDLDPSFRIGEEGELKLLKHDVAEEVLETWYASSDKAFVDFVEMFATGKDDRKLEEIVLQLFEYSRSYPNPEKWLDTCVENYQVESIEELENASFVKNVLLDIKKYLEDVEMQLLTGIDICNEERGPKVYISALESDLAFVSRLLNAKHFQEMQEIMFELKWQRLATNRDKQVLESYVNTVKKIRDDCKKQVEEIRDEYFYDTTEALQEGMLLVKKNMQVLTELVKDFSAAYMLKKQSKNMIDFNDMEHLALQILTKEVDGRFEPSQVAMEYQEKFREIMIDEYQDSNYIQEAILTSVSTVSKGIYNIFMVGDVKQSIYRFRLSRPELFMEKYHTYSETESKQQRIDLHKNFRSRKEVLESTNFIFERIMTKGFGGIEYDEKAALYVGAQYEEQEGNETEICIIDASELAKEDNKKELEAKAVAGKIKKIVGNHIVFDKQMNQYRKARYGDIVILTRSLKGWTDVFLRILAQEGVPAYSVSKEGYFETREIQMLLNYLSILDNPKQDIPFVSVLTSPFAQISSEELAIIQSSTDGKTFYEKVRTYIEIGENPILKEKLSLFLSQYERFRKKVPYTAIHILLWKIIEETGYKNYVSVLPGGEQRAANLEMLIEKAIGFESTSYKGLFHFVRYIEQLYKYEVDYGEANIVDESSDVVRLMSIHKSKGLEFPIVFVAGMDKLFNMQDVRSDIVIHPELGVGLDYVDVEKRVKHMSLLKRIIQKEIQKETVAEELRVLYVAMTRAKEKLILTGTISDLEKRLANYGEVQRRSGKTLPYTWLTKARRYFDWIIPAVYGKNSSIKVEVIGPDEIVLEEMEEEYQGALTKQIIKDWNTDTFYDSHTKKQLEEQFSFVYPYEINQKTKQKKSVSELKKQVYMEAAEIEAEEDVIPLLPKFMQEDSGISGASRGTAYHRVLQLLDFSKEYEESNLAEAISKMVSEEKITSEMAGCVKPSDILLFLRAPIGKRVQKAAKSGKIHLEQPFVLADDADAQDTILVQGIIDVYFEEEGELVVLDYKTDRIWNAEELKERYGLQLDYYAKALERVTGKRVKQKVIYSFTLRKEIEL